MFDQVKLWLRQEDVPHIDFLSEMPLMLRDVRVTYSGNDIQQITGFIKNFRIRLNRAGMYIQGSISNHFGIFGDFYLPIDELNNLIDALDDLFIVPIRRAKVRSLEFGLDLFVDRNPQQYVRQITNSRSYTGIIRYPNSITFSTENRKKIFYIKPLKIFWPTENGIKSISRIRFELRYKNKQLMRLASNLTIEKLISADLIRKLIDSIEREYDSVGWRKPLTLKYDKVITPNDFIKQLAAITVSDYGEEHIYTLIKDIRDNGGLSVKEYPSRARSKVRTLQSEFPSEHKNQYYEEFSDKLEAQLQLMRQQTSQIEP